jgi:hypothetical protein
MILKLTCLLSFCKLNTQSLFLLESILQITISCLIRVTGFIVVPRSEGLRRCRRQENKVRAEAEEDGPHPTREVNLPPVRSQIKREVETETINNFNCFITVFFFFKY